MNLELIQIIHNYLDKNIKELECEIHREVLFGALGGSYSVGLENLTSDIDFYLICSGEYDDKVLCLSKEFEYNGQERKIDFMCVGIETAYKQNILYKKNGNYPSCFYRNLHQDKIAQLPDIQRPDFPKDVLFRTLMSDNIWKNSSVGYDLGAINRYICVMDVLDYNYIRAYGNYVNYIENKDVVMLRKYLYALHEIFTCLWVVRYAEKPPMDFINLLKGFCDLKIKNKVKQMYNLNKNADKSKRHCLVAADIEINQYIWEGLTIVKRRIEEDKDIFLKINLTMT